MIYYGTEKAELIYFQPDDRYSDKHFIAMIRDCDDPVFYVRSCCNGEWEWKFYDTASNYEMVKHAIFDIGLESADMRNMLDALDYVFEDIFEDIVIWDKCECDCDCENGCNHCGCKE